MEIRLADLDAEVAADVGRIKAVCIDVDGTLTDGLVYFTASGEEMMAFNRRDGMAMKRFIDRGGKLAVITRSTAPCIEHRMKQLGLEYYFSGVVNKVEAAEKFLEGFGLTFENCAYIGDDLNDVEILKRVRVVFSVNDAAREVKEIATIVLSKEGGRGAVREALNLIHEAGAP
ncbi:MAG: HAD hydrolase family protein [Planctomycetes bacterium]|nr:HAD hydrolase family protein [Planctomycetota bacterium]